MAVALPVRSSRRKTFLIVAALFFVGLFPVAGGFPGRTATAVTDTTPPQLMAFDFIPNAVDVSTAPATLSLTAHLTDDSGACVPASGFPPCYALFVSPSGQQAAAELLSSNLLSGTPQDGFYAATLTMPVHAEGGTWLLNKISLFDMFGNLATYWRSDVSALNFPVSFEVISANPDTEPPHLHNFDFAPKEVDVSSSAAQIEFSAHLTDDMTGVGTGPWNVSWALFESPSGHEAVAAVFDGVTNLVAGTAQNGEFQQIETVPAHSEPGIWTLRFFVLVDQVSNYVQLTPTRVAAMGFPTTFMVINPRADAGRSTVTANPTLVTADGVATSTVTVTLRDGSGTPMAAHTVALTAASGTSIVSAASGPSDTNGVVTFTVRDATAESVTYSARDTTDAVDITQTATVLFTDVTRTVRVQKVADSSVHPTASFQGQTQPGGPFMLTIAENEPVGPAQSLTIGTGATTIFESSGPANWWPNGVGVFPDPTGTASCSPDFTPTGSSIPAGTDIYLVCFRNTYFPDTGTRQIRIEAVTTTERHPRGTFPGTIGESSFKLVLPANSASGPIETLSTTTGAVTVVADKLSPGWSLDGYLVIADPNGTATCSTGLPPQATGNVPPTSVPHLVCIEISYAPPVHASLTALDRGPIGETQGCLKDSRPPQRGVDVRLCSRWTTAGS